MNKTPKIKISKTIPTIEYLSIGDYVMDIHYDRIGIVKKIKHKEKHNEYVVIKFFYYLSFEGLKCETDKYYNLEDLRNVIINYY
jgi:hypothetical protein